MRQVLVAIVALIGFHGSASAAAITAAPADQTGMMLIGAGLILSGSLLRTRRG